MKDISDIKAHFNQGNYSIAWTNYQKKVEGTEAEDIDALILKSRILRALGNFNEALDITHKLIEKKSNCTFSTQFRILLVHTYNLASVGNPKIALPYIDQLEELLESGQDDVETETLASYYNISGVVLWQIGQLNEALVKYKQCLEINKELSNQIAIASTLNNIGVIYWNQGNLETAIESYNKSLEIYEEQGNEPKMAMTLNNIGLILKNKGEYDTAIEFFEKALIIRTEIGNQFDIAQTKCNMAIIYKIKGDLLKALKIYEESLIIYRELQGLSSIALCLNNMGNIHYDMGDFETAEDYYLDSLTYRGQIDNPLGFALVYYNLIRVNILLDRKQAQIYLERLKQLVKDNDDDNKVGLYYQIARAIYLNGSNHLRSKAEAQELLLDFVSKDVVISNLTIVAIKQLTENLLEELKFYGREDIIENIDNLIVQMSKIAETENLVPVKAQVKIIQYRLELIKGNIKTATQLMKEAKVLTEETGLRQLEQSVNQDIEQMEIDKDLWYNLQQLNLPFAKKIKLSFVNNYIESQQQSILRDMTFVAPSQVEEDDIFSMLSNSTRREILKEIYMKNSISFNEIKRIWDLSSGSTKNHLNSMKQFLKQHEDKSYSLNEAGMAIAGWIFGESRGISVKRMS